MIEYFLEHHGNDAASVFNFPCPDAHESMDELQKKVHETRRRAHSLTSEEIARRVDSLMADPVFEIADTLGEDLHSTIILSFQLLY